MSKKKLEEIITSEDVEKVFSNEEIKTEPLNEEQLSALEEALKPSDVVPEIQTETPLLSPKTIKELQNLNQDISKEDMIEVMKNGWVDEPVVIQPGPDDLKQKLLKDLIIKKEKPELPKTNILNTAKRNVVPVNAPSDGALDVRGYSFKLRPDKPIKN